MQRFKIDDFGEAIRSDDGEFCSYVDAQIEIARLTAALEDANREADSVSLYWKVQADRLTAERDAAFAAGIEAAANIGSSFILTPDVDVCRISELRLGEHSAAVYLRDKIRAITTTDQRAAFDKLVAERVAAELAKRGEPAPTSAVTVRPYACATDGCDRLSEVYFVRADVGSHYCGQCYLKVHGMEQSRLAALSPTAEQEGG